MDKMTWFSIESDRMERCLAEYFKGVKHKVSLYDGYLKKYSWAYANELLSKKLDNMKKHKVGRLTVSEVRDMTDYDRIRYLTEMVVCNNFRGVRKYLSIWGYRDVDFYYLININSIKMFELFEEYNCYGKYRLVNMNNEDDSFKKHLKRQGGSSLLLWLTQHGFEYDDCPSYIPVNESEKRSIWTKLFSCCKCR